MAAGRRRLSKVHVWALFAVIAMLTLSPHYVAGAERGTSGVASLGNSSLRPGPIHTYTYRDGIVAFREVFGVTLEPALTVTHGDYVVDVYYYHPDIHEGNMYNAVFDSLSLLINIVARECYNKTYKATKNIINITKIKYIRSVEKLISEQHRYLWYCPKLGTIFIGTNDTDKALRNAKQLAELLANNTPYRQIIIYRVEYGKNETPRSIDSSYYHRLDKLLEEKYGITLYRITINGEQHIMISEDIRTGRPLLIINTTKYLEMLNTSYEKSKKIARQIGLAVAKALNEINFPLRHVEITVYYSPPVIARPDIATRKPPITEGSLQSLQQQLKNQLPVNTVSPTPSHNDDRKTTTTPQTHRQNTYPATTPTHRQETNAQDNNTPTTQQRPAHYLTAAATAMLTILAIKAAIRRTTHPHTFP